MKAYLVTHNQHRALRIQEPASSNPVQSVRVEDPQILEGHPVSIKGEKKTCELPEGAIVLEGIPVFPQAMDKQEHPESSQDPLPELFEPLTMKKIPAPSLEVKEEAASTPPAPPLRSYKSQSRLKKSSTSCCHLSRRRKKSSTSAPS
ncbi:hypothetical protein Zm00014a_019083 [Zea mays]|uniref:Uncharacterized protein n=1 Tax=Zea mays TaxID=4577 RepID=A0A3L6DF47_MAIZE|nr:hypothetical protein Zm00014a_019083 [Zea mays]